MGKDHFSDPRENQNPGGYDEDFLNDPIFDGINFDDPETLDSNNTGWDYGQDYYSDSGDPNAGYNGAYYEDPRSGSQGYAAYGDQGGTEQTYGDSVYEQSYDQMPPKKKKRRRGPRITGVIFYILFFAAVGVSWFLSQKSLEKTKADLQVFEQAQPVHICQQVFEDLFSSPDWAALYEKAGTEDSTYEGKDAFVLYMQEKVGQTPLAFRQLTFEETKPLEYGVYLDDEKVAMFTMVNNGTQPAVPRWELGNVELYFTAEQDFRIHLGAGQTAYVNGVLLDGSHEIQKSYVQSLEDASIQLPGSSILEVCGLLVTPNVTVKDAEGREVPVTYLEDQRLFQAEISDTQSAVGEEEKEIALEALRTYCKFMINKGGGRGNLANYFKRDTDTYKAIIGSDLTWIQRERSFAFADETVTDYVRYSDDRFSVRASLTWQLTRPDGSVKESLVDESMVFEKSENGWLCTRMTGLELTKPVTLVCLSFEGTEGQQDRIMIGEDTKTVDCPKVTAPEGKTFAGWMTEQTDADGNPYWQRILVPDAQGKAELYPGFPLEPMHLYPVFEPEA